MSFSMALSTQRNDIKPVFGKIPQIMMIVISGFVAALALKRFGIWNFTSPACIVYCCMGENYALVSLSVFVFSQSLCGFSPFAFSVSQLRFFVFRALSIGLSLGALAVSSKVILLAIFALVTKFLVLRMPIKFGKRFNLLALEQDLI